MKFVRNHMKNNGSIMHIEHEWEYDETGLTIDLKLVNTLKAYDDGMGVLISEALTTIHIPRAVFVELSKPK